MSSVVPGCLSGPADEMSALSVSFCPGHWKARSFPQGSLAFPLSRYFCDTRSSIPRGQELELSIMYCAVASRAALTRSRAVETCAFLNCLKTAAPTPPAKRAMMASTTMISSSVNPDSIARAALPTIFVLLFSIALIWISSLHEIRHVHDGLKDRKHDEHHGQRHANDEQGRQDRGQARHLAFDVALVGGGDVLQHGLQLAGTLADRHHVDHQRGELPRTLERVGDRLALTDRVARLFHNLFQDRVVEDLLGDLQRRQHGHAGRQHGRQRAGEPGHADEANQRPDEWQLEPDLVDDR